MKPPTLTDAQRSAASAKAVANRRRRAQVKQQVRSGELSWSRLIAIAQTDEVIAGLRVEEALACVPGVGPQRIAKLMKQADIAHSRRLRGLGELQRALLNEALAR